MARKKPRLISGQLVTLVAVVAAPLVALLGWSGFREYRVSIEHAEETSLALAEATAIGTRQFLAVAENLMVSLASELGDDLADPKRCAEHITRMNGIFTFVVNLLVADTDGNLLCSARPAPRDGPNSIAHREWFHRVLETGSPTIGSPHFGSITGRWVIALGAPILREDGTVTRVLGGSVELVRFQDLLAGVDVGEDELVTIVNQERIVVARSKDPDAWVGKPLPLGTDPERQVGPGRSVIHAADFGGVQRGWGKVVLPELGWSVYAGIPLRHAYGPALATSLRTTVTSVVVIVLALLLAVSIYRQIAGSLRHLVAGVRSAIQGQSVPIPPGAPFEVVEVAEQFNRALDAQARAKQRYRSIFDNAVFGISVATVDGQLLEVNPAFVSLMGYESAEELLSVHESALYRDPAERARVVEEALEESVLSDLELEWVKKDGSPITVRVNGKPILTDSGDRAFEIIVVDITEEKLLEEDLRHTQKMEAIGQLAGGVAHDFNNILTVIGGNAELLVSQCKPGDAIQPETQQIIVATERATTLTRQLLTFSRKDAVKPELVDLNVLLADLQQMLRRLIGEHIHLQTDFGPDLRLVKADAGHLEQVILNLVLNSRDASGSRIVVETRNVIDGLLPGDIGRRHTQDLVVLSVKDDGMGMNDDTRARVFDPFFTTKDKGKGTGLGLATVYGIVRQAGGYITVQSQLGEGSVFEVWLPASEGAGQVDTERPVDTDGDKGHETILAVEDEAPVRKLVQRVLEDGGYRVLLAANGQEALEVAERHPGQIDLIVTDVVMPGMKVTDLIDALEEREPGIGVLFTSGYTDNLQIEDRLTKNPLAFLSKPFRTEELRRRVRALLDQRTANI